MQELNLTVREIQAGRQQLGGVNPLLAMSSGAPEVFEAMAVVAWLLTRRTEPSAPFDRFLDMTVEQIDAELERLAPGASEDVTESPEDNPTEPAPAP